MMYGRAKDSNNTEYPIAARNSTLMFMAYINIEIQPLSGDNGL